MRRAKVDRLHARLGSVSRIGLFLRSSDFGSLSILAYPGRALTRRPSITHHRDHGIYRAASRIFDAGPVLSD